MSMFLRRTAERPSEGVCVFVGVCVCGGGQEEERVSCEGMTVSRQFSPWLLLRDGTQT